MAPPTLTRGSCKRKRRDSRGESGGQFHQEPEADRELRPSGGAAPGSGRYPPPGDEAAAAASRKAAGPREASGSVSVAWPSGLRRWI
ncbi:hypothetical protein chiPu_0016808 [Chiloscyllium punctatum]|uniref:Uncharacterized protein n=1 Tax=Chiloscyllium punctatum TaxID=137246 RepID=A0A401T6S2_CHIPU|nr:hypothetical protein [Chiloscyllium punctatum]